MHADDGLITVGHFFYNGANQGAKLIGHGITDRIGNIDSSSPSCNRGLDHFAEIIWFGTRRIHRRKLHIFTEALCPLHRLHRHFQDLFLALAQLSFEVDAGGAYESVDPGPGGKGLL